MSLPPGRQSAGAEADWRTSFLYEAPKPELGNWPLMAVGTQRWKYIRTFDPEDRSKLAFEELYDLERDPGEMRNLAGRADHSATERELKAEMDGLVGRLGA